MNDPSYHRAQRVYDNREPEESSYPDEMNCPECGAVVNLQDLGIKRKLVLVGTCPKCGCGCEFDLDN